MEFLTYGEPGQQSGKLVLLLHGGGLGPYMWQPVGQALYKAGFYPLATALSGHDGRSSFRSIEAEAERQLEFVDKELGSDMFGLCGLSLGAQVAVEMLSRRPQLTKKAVIESALVSPDPKVQRLTTAAGFFYPLAKSRVFAKAQAKSLRVPPEMFEEYFATSSKMAKRDFTAVLQANAAYTLPESFKEQKADLLVLYGEKEVDAMALSASIIAAAGGTSTKMIKGAQHGFSLYDPQGYFVMLRHFLTK